MQTRGAETFLAKCVSAGSYLAESCWPGCSGSEKQHNLPGTPTRLFRNTKSQPWSLQAVVGDSHIANSSYSVQTFCFRMFRQYVNEVRVTTPT